MTEPGGGEPLSPVFKPFKKKPRRKNRMDFKLSKTHLLQQEMYRKFAENEIKPIAEEMDETEVFDLDLLAKMHKYGLMGIPYSKEYGGVGGDYLSYALCMEEISKIDGSSGITISVHTSLCC